VTGRLIEDVAGVRRVLESVRTVGMVGASSDWKRPSYYVMKYLQSRGYKVIPVNFGAAGQTLLGETVCGSLSEVVDPFEMVNVFRKPEAAERVVDEVIALPKEKGVRVVWFQLGIRNQEAADKAIAAGLDVVMDRCAKIEYGRYHSELAWGGFNTGIISAKRPKVRML